MKITISILIMLLFVGCNSKKESINEEKYFPTKDKFILSDYHRYLDSIGGRFIDADENIIFLENPFKNPNYRMGFTHILIGDNEEIYIHQFKQQRNIKSGYFNSIVNDSINEEEMNYHLKRLDSLILISPNELKDFLIKNKNAYTFEKNDSVIYPGELSIALKRDTLNGYLMSNIFELMKNNGINYYFIRRMNEYELKAVGK